MLLKSYVRSRKVNATFSVSVFGRPRYFARQGLDLSDGATAWYMKSGPSPRSSCARADKWLGNVWVCVSAEHRQRQMTHGDTGDFRAWDSHSGQVTNRPENEELNLNKCWSSSEPVIRELSFWSTSMEKEKKRRSAHPSQQLPMLDNTTECVSRFATHQQHTHEGFDVRKFGQMLYFPSRFFSWNDVCLQKRKWRPVCEECSSNAVLEPSSCTLYLSARRNSRTYDNRAEGKIRRSPLTSGQT